jgi:hypothetical protein
MDFKVGKHFARLVIPDKIFGGTVSAKGWEPLF